MDRLGVRISRCSLALSHAVKLGLGAWLAIALLGGPTGSVALTPPALQGLEKHTAVELTQSRRKKRRARAARSRRELKEQSEVEAHKAPEPAKEQTEKGAGAAPKAGGAEKGSAAARGGSGTSSEATKAAPGGDNAAAGKAADHEPAKSEPEIKEQVWSEAEIIAALEDYVRLLAPIAAHVEVSKPVRSGQCGAPAAVVLKRVGATTPVEVSPPAVINCRMVARLHEWVEATLQPAARDLLKAPVTRMINASGYVCRNRNGSSHDKISEHAFANALDISALVTGDGRTIDVLTHWGKTEADLRAMALAKAEAEKQAKAEAAAAKAAEKAKGKAPAKDDRASPVGSAGKDKDSSKGVSPGPELQQESGLQAKRGRGRKGSEPVTSAERSGLGGGNPRPVNDARSGDASSVTTEGLFLRRLHKGACGLFGTVLGPEANEAHRNHFHFDLAARRRSAFCQ